MKRPFPLYWMFGFCAVILLAACGGGSDDPEPEPTPTPTPTPVTELNVSQTAFNFSGDGGSSSFSVTGNTGWTITSSADWCSVTPTSGTQAAAITVQATANTEPNVRSCTLTVKSTTGNLTKEIAVTQEAHVFTLSVATTTLSVSDVPSTQKIVVEGDDPFEATSSEPTWCAVSTSATSDFKGIEVSVGENETDAVRTATVTIKGKNTGKSFEITVTQKGKELNVSQMAISFSGDGGSSTFSVTGNTNWTLQSSADWCSVTPTEGTPETAVTVQVAANMEASPRTATITVKGMGTGSSLTKEITVTQEAHVFTLNVSTTTLSVPAGASVQKVAVEGDDLFDVTTSQPSWCSASVVTQQDGNGFKGIEVSIGQNTDSTERTATITITGKHTGKQFSITITQERKRDIDRADYDPDRPL